MMKATLCLAFFSCIFTFSPFLADTKEAVNTKEKEEEELKKTLTTWEARLEYARLLSNLHRYDQSLKQYEKLLAEKPDSIIVQSEIAQVLYYQDKREEALQVLEKIPADALDSKGQLLKGDIYQALKEYPQAEAIYRKQLEKVSEDDSTRLKLAEMLSWQRKYEESVELYEQILSRHPDDIQVRRKYGLVLMWMGNDQKAAEELEKTLDE